MIEELKAKLESVLQVALQPIKEDVQTLKGDFKIMLSIQSELQQLAPTISDPQEEANPRLEALTMEVHRFPRDIASLKQAQARQEKIISTLALRSIEHEGNLRVLKKIRTASQRCANFPFENNL